MPRSYRMLGVETGGDGIAGPRGRVVADSWKREVVRSVVDGWDRLGRYAHTPGGSARRKSPSVCALEGGRGAV